MLKKRKHIRSNSCDVKIGRSNSREYDAEYRNRRLHQNRSHSRTNSRDIDLDTRFKRNPTHSRTNSRDEPINIKYILNILKPELLGLPPPVRSSRKHSRNHSYDQIYNMPNNIKFDQELHNKFNKNRNKPIGPASTVIENDLVKNNVVDQKYVRSDGSGPSSMMGMPTVATHSRNNSKDLNKSSFLSSLVDDAAHSILRHRRTNSKDLNRIVNATTSIAPIPSTSAGVCDPCGSGCGSKQQPTQHRRNLSQTNTEFPEEDTLDVLTSAAQVLLQRNHETSDNIDTDMQRNN